MAKKLRRPTREMMLAINALLDGKKADSDKIVKEHKLDAGELATRLEMRAGEKYGMTRKTKQVKKAAAPKQATPPTDVAEMIDGRTKIVTLVKLEARVQDLLAQKPAEEVKKVRDALKNLEKLNQQLDEAKAVLGL